MKVNLLNIDSMPPIKQGVNTPRSCGICAQKGVNPKDLIPRKIEDFMKGNVSQSLATSRHRRYEVKRQGLLRELRPLREAYEKVPTSPFPPNKEERFSGEGAPHRSPPRSSQSPPRSPNRYTDPSPYRSSGGRPSPYPLTEQERLRREEERWERECAAEMAKIIRISEMLEKQQREAERVRGVYLERYKKKVAHFHNRVARKSRVISNLETYDQYPERSPLRKTTQRARSTDLDN